MSSYSVVSRGAKQQKRRKLLRRLVSFLIIMVVLSIVLALWIYWRSMSPTILDIAQTRLKAETTLAVNEAVCVILSDVNSYSDFFTVEKNNQNDIVMISANSALVNIFARNTAILSQQKISALKSFSIDIPIGSLSGIPLLSEKGPTVDVVVSPIGNVTCTFTSVFETAGINQTLHRIYVNVCSNVDLIMPTSHVEVKTETPILLSESLIIGKVPDTFLQGGLVLGTSA
ncbi:MAG: sporulation protein YunB [Clostridiales bacterium]|nr:sporulation protein YunB [Clostridiales bacterium]